MQSFSSTPKQKYTKSYSHPMKSFIRIVSLGLVLFLPVNQVKTEKIPTDLVYPNPGCGTDCSNKQISISYPEKIDNGWIRVKIENTFSWKRPYPYSPKLSYNIQKGEEGFYWRKFWIPRVTQEWVFANCSEGLYGSGGVNKDMSDSRIRSVYWMDDSGNKRYNDSHTGGFTYSNWKELCN